MGRNLPFSFHRKIGKLKSQPKVKYGKWKIQGFTLVELLVVISILGVLASIMLAAFRNSQARGRDAQRKANLKELQSSLELFYADYGEYPSASAGEIGACPYDPSASSGTACVWGEGSFTDGKTVYFTVLPQDPISAYHYLYRVDSTNQKFQIFATLENSEDPQIISTAYDCGGGDNSCNFVITSPNTSATDF